MKIILFQKRWTLFLILNSGTDTFYILQSRKAVTAYFESKQLLPFNFSDHSDKSGFLLHEAASSHYDHGWFD